MGVMKGPGPSHLTAVLPCWDALLRCPAQTLPSWDWPVNNGPVISLGWHRHTAEGCVWPHACMRARVCVCVCVRPGPSACFVYLPVQSFTLTVLPSALLKDWCIHIEYCWFKHMLNLMHNASTIYSLIKSTVSTLDRPHTLWGWMCRSQKFFLFVPFKHHIKS